MGFLRQVKLLLWKNLLLQRRKVVVSVFEVLLPVGFALIILAIRTLTDPKQHDKPTTYNPFDISGFELLHMEQSSVNTLGFYPDTPLTRRIMDNCLDDVILALARETAINPWQKNQTIAAAGVYTNQSYVVRLAGGGLYTSNASNVLLDFIFKTKGVLLIPADAFLLKLKAFDDEKKMVEYYKINSGRMKHAVVFKGISVTDTVLPLTASFFVRPKTEDYQKWRTANTYAFYQDGTPNEIPLDRDYLWSGFIAVQNLVVRNLIREWGVDNASFGMSVERMPYPPYVMDPMLKILQEQLPIFLILSFILSVIQSTKSIVYEKERKLKESMKMMGLMPSAHWTAWFIHCYIYLAVACAIYAILFGITVSKKSGPVLAASDASLFYVFLLCYSAAIVTFCFMISVMVQRANIGAAVSGVMFFAFYLPNFFLRSRYQTMTYSQKVAACLLFNQAMAFGANVIGLYEGTGEGAKWGNFHRPAMVDDNFSLLDSMGMLLLDCVLHLIITWILDNVHPGEYGVPKFLCFSSLKFGYAMPVKASITQCDAELVPEEKYFEKDPTELKAGIQIKNLRKVFGKEKVAVDNLNLNIYEGQITVLLGHNGAGKTTTMSMLTGFTPPTSGTAYINGLDIRTDIESVRKSLGLCPQHNILFGTLTVEEHLIFFAELKGCPSDQVKKEVDTMITEVGLQLKRNSAARTLSGGQKRKLSVAIALLYGSKVVVLDEPSSGMDPAARRQLWDVLQRHREGCTMLLTTHFMDEADLLGDRIAIMAEGVVKCCGTSMFLKKLYGAGYHLVLVKTPECKVSAITSIINKIIPNSQFESEINAELTYLLPDDQSALFPELFNKLDDKKQELGIVNFGASATTMEEVFLKVGESASTEETMEIVQGVDNPNYQENDVIVGNSKENGTSQTYMESINVATDDTSMDVLAFSQGYTKNKGLFLQLSQLWGLVEKKAIHFWRNRIITLVQLLLPVIFTIIALAVEKAIPNLLKEPALAFDLQPFSNTIVPYSSHRPVTDSLEARYTEQFSNAHKTEPVNLRKTNMTTYFLDKAKQLGTTTYNRRMIIGAHINMAPSGWPFITAWYNGQPLHGLPITTTYAFNAMAKHFVNSSVNIRIGIDPFPKNEDADVEANQSLVQLTGFIVGFSISFGMAFLVASFIYFLIKERVEGAKHMQVVSGVGPCVFWIGNLIWDYVNYLLPSMLLLAVFAAYGTEAYVKEGHLGLVTAVLVLYGFASLPFVYFIHFAFSSPPTGMVVLIILNIITGLITMTTVLVMTTIEDTRDLGETLNWVFMGFFPNHCMGRCLNEIYFNYFSNKFCNDINYTISCYFRKNPCCRNIGLGCDNQTDSVCLVFSEDYLSWEAPGLARYFVFMVLQGVTFLGLTMLMEYKVFRRLGTFLSSLMYRTRPALNNSANPLHEDDDVALERRRINAAPAFVLSKQDSLLLVNLFKQYGSFVAVDHTCVGVPEGECFGLLGQNGAGKTTTFKMLTGDVAVTGGNAYLQGYDVKNSLQQVQMNMGYCPQFDALIEQMTGRETLTMYARLRGVPRRSVKMCVNSLIDTLLLRPHADKLTREYSGGNKRKLSTAIALIGNPPFILLDEPSSGMDPVARRQLWNVLSQVRASGRTLVLTSHSMEECEALCTRIAIMVNGKFVCLGSTQHLKSKFGQGYTLVAKMATEKDGSMAPVEPFVSFVQEMFPSAKLFESNQGYAHIQVPDPNVKLADVFSAMERTKHEFHVEDYNIHQTTLEQVFLAFTRVQVPPKEKGNRSCIKSFMCCLCNK